MFRFWICTLFASIAFSGVSCEPSAVNTTVDVGPDVSSAKSFANSAGIRMVRIEAGEFDMGSSDKEIDDAVAAPGVVELDRDSFTDEQPHHRVRITQPFYMAKHEVTQSQFEKVMGRNPSSFSQTGIGKEEVAKLDTRRYPVENVSWFDAVEFCNAMSAKEDRPPCFRLTNIQRKNGSITSADIALLNGTGYRLPTEAEWEYACRSGTATAFHFGGSHNGSQANTDGYYPFGTTTKGPFLHRPTTVGSYPANAWGLCDMHGNVSEWCQDWYDATYYQQFANKTAVDPQGPTASPWNRRAARGGSWYTDARTARSGRRMWLPPEGQHTSTGFRVVCMSGEKSP